MFLVKNSLSPYYCHYNPTKLVWSQVKLKVVKQNRTVTMAEVERLRNNELKSVIQESWASCARHAEKLEI
jgi:hypothetical protein